MASDSAFAPPFAPPATGQFVPFTLHRARLRGRLVRAAPVASDILSRHGYPAPLSALVAESVVLTSLLATGLKFDGVFTLQTQGNGPVSRLVADMTTDGKIRACATYDAERLDQLLNSGANVTDHPLPHLLGSGHLAFTVDQGPDMERYQGIVELTGERLADSVHSYFHTSEQLDTVLHMRASVGDTVQAAGILIQKMPADPVFHINPDDAEDEWRTAAILLASLTEDELHDPALAPADLLFRLFHQEELQVAAPQILRFGCRCSSERVENTLKSFGRAELADMVTEAGQIEVTCEFCSTRYDFTPVMLFDD